jgi:hypothetical protein
VSIRDVIPMPTPVTLGGVGYLASELRLHDLAQLQAFVDSRHPSPYDAACGAIAIGAESRSLEWKRLLAATVEAQAAWPKEPGSPEADEFLSSREGRMILIGLVLAREHPGLGRDDLSRIYAATTAGEFARLSRIAWGNEPMRELMALIDGPEESGGKGPDWGRLWVEYGREFRGPAFPDLTISQFVAWRRGGECYTGRVGGDDHEIARISERREAFWQSIETTTNRPEDVHVRG